MDHRTATVIIVALALFSANAPPCIAGDFNPAARNIDAVCDGYLPHAASRDVVRIEHATGDDGTATVVFDAGSLVFARAVSSDPKTGTPLLRSWCFMGGRLARTIVDVTVESTQWNRARYYNDDLANPFDDSIRLHDGAALVDPRTKPPMNALVIEPYGVPSALPFYKPAVAAIATPSPPPRRSSH